MVELDAWFDPEAEGPTPVRTPADLDAVLDTVTGWEGANSIQLFVAGDPGRGMLEIGLDSERGRGVAFYSASGQAYYSHGPEMLPEPPLYYYQDNDTEYPADAELPLEIIRRTAHDFLATGQRPATIEWRLPASR
ncbi:Imm1 family immunity protein [Amycolatopsis thermoflava]|uniref:Imm1 family immunity protein n=1 Tax=Amycolatopsis thermoflava TaxID=84480 RepID=UPI003D738523